VVNNSVGKPFREIVEVNLDRRGFGSAGGGEEDGGSGGGVEREGGGIESGRIGGLEKGVEESVEK